MRRFFLLLNHFKQLIQTRFSLHGFEYPIFTHEHEVSFASKVNDFFWAATLADESSDFIRKIHHFVYTDTSLVSCHTTLCTTLSFMESVGIFFESESGYTNIFEHIFDDIDLTRVCLICGTTVWTYTTYEPLCDDDIQS